MYLRNKLKVLSSGIQRHVACSLLYAGFLLGLIFDHEDGGDIFLRNVGGLSLD
jgi:hypothetical protein